MEGVDDMHRNRAHISKTQKTTKHKAAQKRLKHGGGSERTQDGDVSQSQQSTLLINSLQGTGEKKQTFMKLIKPQCLLFIFLFLHLLLINKK